jgi:hypothetical protein
VCVREISYTHTVQLQDLAEEEDEEGEEAPPPPPQMLKSAAGSSSSSASKLPPSLPSTPAGRPALPAALASQIAASTSASASASPSTADSVRKKLSQTWNPQAAQQGDADEQESIASPAQIAEKRKLDAIKWTDKEIRKLISEIVRLGAQSPDGKHEVSFGTMFNETANIFEALSGTLKTAKKHKVVHYEGDLLLQGAHNHVVITLLKTEIEDSSPDTYTRQLSSRKFEESKAKHSQLEFGGHSLREQQLPCHICKKKVYPSEFVGASDKPFHQACFRCHTCKKALQQSNYSTINDLFFCPPHYEQYCKANLF